MRVLLVDDERLLLKTMERSLSRLRPGWELLLASSGEEGIALLRRQGADAVVADLLMPGMDGMALLTEVRADADLAPTPYIIITARDDRGSMRAGMSAGADDYLTKPFTAEELIAAVETRMKRQTRPLPTNREAEELRSRLEIQLTPRELVILKQIGTGLGSKEIAAALAISPRTVDVHRTNMMRKLDLHNAASLAGLAVKAGIA